MGTALPLTHLARVECADQDIPNTPCTIEHHLSLTLCIDLHRTPDAILGGFDATARKKVRRVERLGGRVTIRRYNREQPNGALIDEFVSLFNTELVEHKRGAVFSLSSAQVLTYLPNADLFLIDLDDKLVMGRLCMRDEEAGRIRQLYAANRRFDDSETARLAANLNVFLHWHELQTYRTEGFDTYDLGGISPLDDPGINRFKLQFGGEVARLHSYFFAGTPRVWRFAFALFSRFTSRGGRRQAVERAGDRWRDVPLDQIRTLIEAGMASAQPALPAACHDELSSEPKARNSHSERSKESTMYLKD
jgi:hypothetical protein